MTIREKVLLEGEDRASQAFDKAGGSFEKMGGTFKKVALTGGIAIAGAKLLDLAGQAVKLAVDAGEAEAAFNTTFGEALPEMTRFVEDFANKAGFTTGEMQQLLAVTGNVAQGIGATEAESADLAQSMATLAGDVASFSNAAGGAPAVLQALQSAMNGEREALKTYGLAISEAEVQERALATTQKTRAEDLTRLEKAQATMAVAYEKAGKAVGDLERTEDSAANTLRRLQARVKEAGTAAGAELLPALEEILPVIEDLIPALGDAAASAAAFFGTLATAATPALEKVDDVMDGLSIAANTAIALGATLAEGAAELFTFGQADTTGLRNMSAFAVHANDIIDVVRQIKAEQVPGANAATQYANAVAHVGRESGISTDLLDQVATATGATAEEQLTALGHLRDYAEANDFAQADIFKLIDAEVALKTELGLIDTAYLGAGFAAHLMAEETTAAAETIPQITEEGEKAADAIVKMGDAALEAAAAFRDDLAAEANDFITGFEELPDRVDTTMDEFEDNLTDRVEEQTKFWEGLAALARAGFGHLAEEIRVQGPSATGLLETLVGDMERAAELDDMIQAAGTQMGEVTDEYATALEENGDAILTPLGQFGLDMTEAIAAGIDSGDLTGPLLAKVNEAVRQVTGRTGVFNVRGPVGSSGPDTGIRAYQEGTWAVPGGPGTRVNAVLHGSEIVVPPEGTGGRAEFARQIAAELSAVMGGGGSGATSVRIDQVTVLVPAGTTVGEAITAGGAQAAIEALLN